jgi:hypothetical protein
MAGTILATGTTGSVSASTIFGGIATDSTNIYWGESGNGSAPGGVIKAIPLEGGDVTVLASCGCEPQAIAVDETGVYWTAVNVTDQSDVAAVMSTPLGGGASKTLWSGGDVGGLVVDSGNVYFAQSLNSGGAILKVAKTGGTAVVFAKNQPYPWALAMDSTNLYWTSNGGTKASSIMKLPFAGGSPSVLASARDPGSVAVDSTFAYWTEQGYCSAAGGCGSVMKVPLAGGTPVVVASGQDAPGAVAVDSTGAFWTTESAPSAVVQAGLDGAIKTLASGAWMGGGRGGFDIAVDESSVYFLTLTLSNGGATRAANLVKLAK